MSSLLPTTAAMLLTLSACAADPDDPAAPATESPPTHSPEPQPEIGTWTDLADIPQRRTEFSVAVLDGEIYMAGGFHQGQGGPTPAFRYDPGTDSWSDLAPLPEPRHHAPLTAYGGEVFVVGGFSHGAEHAYHYHPTDTLFIYDVADDSWRLGPPLPDPVGAQAVTVTDHGTVHVIGGVGEGGTAADVTNAHQVYDTTTGTWDTLPAPELRREHHGAAYLDGVIYVAAGRNGAQGNELEAYDIESGRWSRLPDAPTVGRSGVAVVAFQGQIYVIGGESVAQGVFDEVERYDPATRTWQAVTPMREGRHGLGAAALDDGIVLVGGGPRLGISFTDTTEIWRP
ncbi:hypothetical protein JQS43_10510 [Natronosporangium hydrolyticum]|uniref:Galactose oxidase n=1 Tax=Natronosporangium hydrolyticum TaxID=2811111 RepID=A0A895YFS4_9ACTN|nr:kelch repeat-containing protein [Natronosporangium hydrolyticum]QSB16667.1 hypothetical protein JQS43_10510 [Natronosporangium hydrolyticum]